MTPYPREIIGLPQPYSASVDYDEEYGKYTVEVEQRRHIEVSFDANKDGGLDGHTLMLAVNACLQELARFPPPAVAVMQPGQLTLEG